MRDRTSKPTGSRARFGARLSREEGTVIKDWGGRLPIALIYPNTYYLGMSNLGIHAIYRLLNSYNDVVCERVFLEPGDTKPPVSVESQRPLTDFAVLAFSLSYELDYFNVVSILRGSGLPLYTTDRDERHPLVIAGGPTVTANPRPLAPFGDCFCVGEAEAILPTMLPILSEGTSERRDDLIKTLAALPGIYVPSLPPATPVARQWAPNLDDFATTSVVLTPDTELGDLYLIEAERGCQRGCRFCLVGGTFSPMRFRAADRLIEQARQGLKHRRRIGLVGPAVTDHPQIEEILAGLLRLGAEISVSSMRIDSLNRNLLKRLSQGKARTVTMAPEAGSERLRQVIRKGISDDDIMEAAEGVAAERLRQLKLYFMLGLPTETDEDAAAIVRLALAIKDIIDRGQSGTRITINVAPFVPKAGTPFQWQPMAPLPDLNHRLSLLRGSLPPKGITVKAESPAWSRVQGVLARGDTEVAGALANTEEVSLAGWRRAVEKSNLDVDYYVNKAWGIDKKLPWDVIDSGIKKEYLIKELEKALLL